LGITIYLIGVVVQIPFVDTPFYTGSLVSKLAGVDISWIVGLIVPGVLYYFLAGRASQARAPTEIILPTR
jgi:NCS1 family nucleobase:cation symporter-1